MYRNYKVPSVVLETSAKQQIDRAYTLCAAMSKNTNMLVVGPKGSGKPTALLSMCDSHSVFYTEATHARKSLSGLLDAILADNGHHDRPQYTPARFDAVKYLLECRGLGETPKKTLIIDEVQKIEWSAWLDIMHIGERAGATILFAGNEHSLVGSRNKKEKDYLAPIASRLMIKLRVEQKIARDFEIFASSFGVEGMDAYRACTAYGMRTDLRSLEQLLDIARQFAGSKTIQLPHLQGAALIIHPANADELPTPKIAPDKKANRKPQGLSSQLAAEG